MSSIVSPTITASTERSDVSIRSTGCCPRFDPTPWQEREIVWQDKLFVKEPVHCIWHVPLDLGRAVTRASARIQAANASPDAPLLLSDDTSPWVSDLYLEVTKEVAGASMVHFSGTYLTKVFEGPYRDAPRWMHEMQAYVAAKGKRLERIYLGYTTCPKCAQAYGKNYVVLFAKVT